MFSDENLDPVEFKSCWRKERNVSYGGSQTDDLQVNDVGCQSFRAKDESTQTEDSSDKHLKLAKVDNARLLEFLQSVEPMIIRCLKGNLKSRAFEDYERVLEEKAATVTCVHTLSHTDLNGELQVTGLSWNATGSTIAASYGRFDHVDWCTHRSAVTTWNLDRRAVKEEKPDSVIDSACCVMCLQFHPENPAWIAGGNFNGEVLVWDLSKEDDLLLAASGIGEDAHREPVTRVHWLRDVSSKQRRYNVISISGDGKILVWKIDHKKGKLKLVDGFMVMAQSLPRNMKVRGVRGDKEIGVTSLSFSHEDPDTFLVGTESGCIFRCSMHTKGNPAGSHIISSVPLHSPVTFTFTPHHGPVHSVDVSLFHRHAFLSCSMDQCLRVYNLLQAQPLLIIEPGEGYLFAASWSPVCPTLLGAVTESGFLLLYDLSTGQPIPAHRVQASPGKQPIFAMQFNAKQTQLLATGDGAGNICIFKLSSELLTSSVKELEQLATLINTGTE